MRETLIRQILCSVKKKASDLIQAQRVTGAKKYFFRIGDVVKMPRTSLQ